MATSIEKLDKNFAPAQVADGQSWYDTRTLGLEGRGWTDTETDFDRLPLRAKAVVRPPVWELSQHSAGISVRFVTDAPSISAKWKLRSANLAMNHMPATGVSGLDLYAKVKGKWVWAGVGVPQGQESTAQLVGALLPGKREYLLNLPLYNGVESLSIGIPSESKMLPAPRRKGKRGQGVVVYGTSIVQGGCACRAGMGYPEIMGRALDCHVINQGYSGNGPMELEMAPFLAELDPAVFVIDSLPNMNQQMTKERPIPFVQIIRKARPRTPIVLVESITVQRYPVQVNKNTDAQIKNANLAAAFRSLVKSGVKGLHYVKGHQLLGPDNLGTVDSVHPTDVGFMRMAAVIGKTAKPLLK
ncbi:MAG: SGNH/GDSL hydrolase family protein [Planctomycetes bacterium]|nr:SGNH/GDSL hydrolase family protein [Planctomycetota bacterium]